MTTNNANAWNPQTILNLSADTKRVEERFTADAGQSQFVLKTFSYAVGTGSLAVYKSDVDDLADNGAGLLAHQSEWAENNTTTFSIATPAKLGDQVIAVGYVAITADVQVLTTDIYIDSYQNLRDYVGIETTLYAKGNTIVGDGGQYFFQLVTGAAPAFYVDNDNTIIVPTGGDGSSAWIRPPREFTESTVATMVANEAYTAGDTVTTSGRFDGWAASLIPLGGASYAIALLADVRTAIGDGAWVPDEAGDHTLANGNVAVLQAKNNTVDLMSFGILADWNGSSGTDNILTLRKIFEYIDRTGYSTTCSGRGTAYIDWTTLGVGNSEAENVLHTFDGVHNVDFNFGGLTIQHNTPQDDGRLLMRFDNSSFITLSDQNHVGTLLVDTAANHRLSNIWLVNFRENCNNITHRNIKVNNIYRLSGYGATTASGLDSAARFSTRVHTIHFENVEMVDCKYGLHCNNSGDNLTGKITSRNLVRTHYIQNAKHHDLIIDSQFGRDKSDVLITNQIDDNFPAEENVIDDIKINYITDGKAAGSGTSGLYEGFINFTFIQVNDLSTMAGMITNVELNLEINNTAVDVMTNIVSLLKYYSVVGTIVVDPTTNSAHRFKNIKITGKVDGGANCTQSILALPQPVHNAVPIIWSAAHFANIDVSNFNCNGESGEFGIHIDGSSAASTTTPLFSANNVVLGGTLTVANETGGLISISNTVTKDEVWYDGYVEGSNANGDFKRYSNGRLEMTFSGVSQAVGTITGSLWQAASPTLTYPFPATSIDSIIGEAKKNVGITWGTIDSFTLTTCVVRMLTSTVGSTAFPEYTVIGRWKA